MTFTFLGLHCVQTCKVTKKISTITTSAANARSGTSGSHPGASATRRAADTEKRPVGIHRQAGRDLIGNK